MKIYSPTIIGDTSLTGTLDVTGGITGSLLGTASFAESASAVSTTPATDNVEYALTFVAEEAAGTQQVRTDDNANITFNPSTGVLSVPTLSGNATNATSASHALIADDLVSSANINITSISASNASFINLTAVSASFGSVTTVTGSAVIIGDEFIILNANPPVARYAGLLVYDSGSGLTASLEWDGEQDTWIAVEETGQSAFILTGPSGSRGSEVFPTVNKLQKGGGFNYLVDSSITDDGTNVIIDTNLIISGSAVGQVANITITSSTGSIDCSTGNFFTLTLASGVDTHLAATSIQAGQTINLKITNNATSVGTISFAPEFQFTGGTPFAVTATTSAVDVMTFISFDGTTLQATGLKNFS